MLLVHTRHNGVVLVPQGSFVGMVLESLPRVFSTCGHIIQNPIPGITYYRDGYGIGVVRWVMHTGIPAGKRSRVLPG